MTVITFFGEGFIEFVKGSYRPLCLYLNNIYIYIINFQKYILDLLENSFEPHMETIVNLLKF